MHTLDPPTSLKTGFCRRICRANPVLPLARFFALAGPEETQIVPTRGIRCAEAALTLRSPRIAYPAVEHAAATHPSPPVQGASHGASSACTVLPVQHTWRCSRWAAPTHPTREPSCRRSVTFDMHRQLRWLSCIAPSLCHSET